MTLAGKPSDNLLQMEPEHALGNGRRIMTPDGCEARPDGGLRQMCLAMRGELRRFLLARRISESDAEDILQDMFLRVETIGTGPVRSPRAYLYQMVNNMAHTRRRTESRQQSRDAWWSGAADFPAGTEQMDAAPDPETTLLARDYLARVENSIAGLPERTAYIFRQYRIESVPQSAIARELGISVSAVEKHLQRAYRAVLQIRDSLDHGCDAPQDTGGANGPTN